MPHFVHLSCKYKVQKCFWLCCLGQMKVMSLIETTGNVQSMEYRTGTRRILEMCNDWTEQNTRSLVNHNVKDYSTISFATHIRHIFTTITSEYGLPLIYLPLYYSKRAKKECTKICMFLLINWFLVHFTFHGQMLYCFTWQHSYWPRISLFQY